MFLRSICSIVRYSKCRNRYLERKRIGEKFRRTSLSTTRDGSIWDVTRWIYDTATGLCTSKIYADGSRITYTYTLDGLPLRTTYASGRWTENVYNERREVIETLSSDNADNVSYVKDEFGRIVSEANSVATVTYSLASSGIATNELWTLGNHTATVARSLDRCGRISFNNGMHFAYSEDGKIKGLSNGLAKVEYLYSLDRLDVGYKIELPNGRIFTRNTIRDSFRRGLMVNVASSMNDSEVDGVAYVYDALERPVFRNSDSFGYNGRSEVIGATVSGVASVYGYDEIGNSSLFAANNLNQYSQFQYDLDGNMLFDGNLSFAYDSNNRLKTVSSNGVALVTNFYDAKSRRVKKVTPNATTTFVYDDWNLIEERVAYTDGTTSTTKYYWGKDLSGTLQGAGGVGGLLYETIDGVIYIPCYDNNGNITKYVDANGGVVASYTYDAFGKLIAKFGPLADVFRHRFSTKYFDIETGLYYYGYRFYNPDHMRWLNRDPIEENGGFNLYGFCGNNAVNKVDYVGLLRIVYHTFGKAPPDGWGHPNVRGVTTINFKQSQISMIKCGGDKLSYRVVFNPSDSCADIYLSEMLSMQTIKDEMEHVECGRILDNALDAFKKEIESICECQKNAESLYQKASMKLKQAKNECDLCNARLDAKGGPHGH